MELPVNKEELTYIFKEIGLELDAKPGEYIFEIADFYLHGINAKRLFKETENIDELNYLPRINRSLFFARNDIYFPCLTSYPAISIRNRKSA